MIREGDPIDEALPLSVLERVVNTCLEFEDVWIQGGRPHIEEYVGTTEGTEQAHLLRELIQIELQYRLKAKEKPTSEEYQKRFHLHTEVIEGIEFPSIAEPKEQTSASARLTGHLPYSSPAGVSALGREE